MGDAGVGRTTEAAEEGPVHPMGSVAQMVAKVAHVVGCTYVLIVVGATIVIFQFIIRSPSAIILPPRLQAHTWDWLEGTVTLSDSSTLHRRSALSSPTSSSSSCASTRTTRWGRRGGEG